MAVFQFKKIGVDEAGQPVYNLNELLVFAPNLVKVQVRMVYAMGKANKGTVANFYATFKDHSTMVFNENAWFIQGQKRSLFVVSDEIFKQHYGTKKRKPAAEHYADKIARLKAQVMYAEMWHAQLGGKIRKLLCAQNHHQSTAIDCQNRIQVLENKLQELYAEAC